MKCTNLVEFTAVFLQETFATENSKSIVGIVPVNPSKYARDIDRLRKLAVQLESLNLQACNTGLTDRQETRAENICTELRTICGEYGIEAVTQGDPRGAAFGILCKHTGKYNSWGGAESGFRLMFEGK